MRKLAAWLFVVALFVTTAAATTPPIPPDALLAHIKFLASDEMKGRASGSPELERAADYIAGQFKSAGLRPGGTSGDWFQPFELVAGLTQGNGNSITVHGGDRTAHLALAESYLPLSVEASDSPSTA